MSIAREEHQRKAPQFNGALRDHERNIEDEGALVSSARYTRREERLNRG
jgi:hypothetical protein